MKLLVDEPGSDEVSRLWAGSSSRVSSLVLYPEACAALAAAARGGRLGSATAGDWRRPLERLWSEVERFALTLGIAHRAGALAELHALRGYDAIHLASCEAIAGDSTVLLTFDDELRTAARRLDLAVAPVAPL